jgi:hypothetical protein
VPFVQRTHRRHQRQRAAQAQTVHSFAQRWEAVDSLHGDTPWIEA